MCEPKDYLLQRLECKQRFLKFTQKLTKRFDEPSDAQQEEGTMVDPSNPQQQQRNQAAKPVNWDEAWNEIWEEFWTAVHVQLEELYDIDIEEVRGAAPLSVQHAQLHAWQQREDNHARTMASVRRKTCKLSLSQMEARVQMKRSPSQNEESQ
ncbi:hypothetical protein BC940DRAFT_298639 [Gongronella butleri]|nr:hypothetical protein BC940DRAFT_298639 [Gongronella butleri]